MPTIINISDAATLAIHAMAYVASREDGRRVSVGEMSECLGVSGAHLSKVVQRLAQLGYLESRRGPGGGFTLGRPAETIRLLEVFEAVDGPLPHRTCLLKHQVCNPGECLLGDLVGAIRATIYEQLQATSLAQFVGRRFGSRDPDA